MSVHAIGRADPNRPLVRARPLSASDQHYTINDRNKAPGPTLNGFKLGTSFRRTLHDFKGRSSKVVQRSRSLNTRADAQSKARHLIHSRSLSDFKMAGLQAGVSLGLSTEPSVEQTRVPTLSTVSGEPKDVPSLNDQVGPSPPALSDIKTLHALRQGTLLTKVSAKKQQVRLFRLDADLGQIVWVSKTQKIIPIECVKEIRSGEDIRYTREHLHLAEDYQDRWFSIIYVLDGNYKTLHLIAPDRETFEMWNNSLRALFSIRQELMRGLGNGEMRQALWEKQYWKAADEEPDHKLSFNEIEGLCRKLNVNVNREDLLRMFKQSDVHNRHYLDFNDFRLFVKLLKARPEIERIYKKLCGGHGELFTFQVFSKFMKETQKSKLDQNALQILFNKYSSQGTAADIPAVETDTQTLHTPSLVMTVEAFTSFLLSPDNSALSDQHSSISQDMTFSLPHYYISSSHNTYLVGHQLVGDSSTEGYIRALLHGCRSVEVDIYDGEADPMVFHGKTLTSKVPLRDVCRAIIKYGFSSSPYPIIISAEVHCSIQQQTRIAAIMVEEFGDALVRTPVDGVTNFEALPSPEELKGKILLKVKNQNIVRVDSADSEVVMSEFSPSGSDSDAFQFLKQAASSTSNPSSESLHKEKMSKTNSTFLQRLKSIGKKPIPPSKDNVMPHSPQLITSFSNTPISRDASQTNSGLIHRAQRSLRGSFSSNSDGPSTSSERSTSSSELQVAAPQSLTFVQRLRMGPETRSSEPSSSVLLQPPPRSLVISAQHLPSRRRQSAPGSETATDPPSSSLSFPLSSSPMSYPLNTVDANVTNLSLVNSEMRAKSKMSPQLLSLLVYTVGVKFRGINKKEEYKPEHMFSLSENVANKMMRFGMWDLIKHTKNHLVRTYPKGIRVSSTNYEPHRFWAAGMQLVALNWQTFDLGYMINHAMFQRNGRSGYVLKPDAIRLSQKDILAKRTQHVLRVKVISGQQLPRPKDASGREIGERQVADPYVEVTLFVPDWPIVSEGKKERGNRSNTDGIMSKSTLLAGASTANSATSSPNYTVAARTSAVRKNGFNPVWEEELGLQFDCVGDMMDLVFVRFLVKQEAKDTDEPLAVYCASLGSLTQGYRHLPLHDSQMSQYLFSTLFVHINITAATAVS